MRQDNPVVIWSLRLFRMLLILYPRAFRRDYGREMTLVFRDTCRQVNRHKGSAGILELWLTTILDLFSTALVERLTEVNKMSTTALFTRISGLVAAVGGILLLILVYGEFVIGGASEMLGLLMLAYGLGVAIGAAGFYTLGQYDEPASRVALGLVLIGGLILSAGLLLLILLESDAAWITGMLGMFLYEIGLVIFGRSAFKHKPLPRWNTLPLIVGVLALTTNLAAMIIDNAENEISFAIWLLVNGLGWVALGVLLMLGDKRAVYHTGAAA
jgi:hypothetical protein